MKTPMLGLVVAAAACAASSLYLWHELAAEREQAAQVDETNRKLQARINELERMRALFAQQHMSTLPAAGGPLFHGAPPPPVKPDGAITAEVAPASGPQAWTPPEPPERSATFKKVMRAQLKVANKRLYADLGTELGLDKNTTDKLIDLLAAQQMESFDQMSTDPAAAEQKFAELQRQNKAAIEALIGPEKAQALEDYQQSTPARAEFDMLARQLEANDVPLTAEQVKKLRTVYIEERERVPQPAYAEGDSASDKYFKALNDWQEDYDHRVSDAASSILNSEQLTAYNDIQQWRKEMRNGIALPTGGGPRGFFRAGGAVPMGAVAGAVTFAVPAPPPPPPPGAGEARKP